MTEITPWHWAGFIVCILFFVSLDLGVFSRRPRSLGYKKAFVWSGIWVVLAMLFALVLGCWRGRADAMQFTTGYLIELSLSLDNILAIALIFSAFRLSPALQHHALFWGILGALIMRGLMIGVGAALIHRFVWVLYLFGGFLVVTGFKTLFAHRHPLDPEKEPLTRMVRRWLPVSAHFDGLKFVTRENGRRALTPLALVVLLVESSDLLFACDSVPAVFSVTRNAFIVFTSNVFAIIGLRSLFFLLAGALDYFRYLKFGLALVLIFVGTKMLAEPHSHPARWFQFEISNAGSLLVILSLLVLTMVISVAAAPRGKRMAR